MLTPIDLKRDYADRSLLDPSRWNADQLALMTAINKLISSVTDGDSGADSVAMTPIAELGDANRVQVVFEALVAALKSTTAGGGAAFVNSQGIAGLTGETVYALLVALKGALDTHKVSHDHDGIYLTEAETTALLDALAAALNTHKGSGDHDGRYYTEGEIDGFISLLNAAIGQVQTNLDSHKASGDHDGRYHTKTELGATTDGASGADKIGVTGIAGLIGNTVQAILEAFKTFIDTNFLSKTNTDAYSPTAQTHPATKGYVDETVAGVSMGMVADGSVTEPKLATALADKINNGVGASTALKAEVTACFQGNRNLSFVGGGQMTWGVTANTFAWSKVFYLLPAGGKMLVDGVAITRIRVAIGSKVLTNELDCMYITIPTTDDAVATVAVGQYNAITGSDKLILAVRDADNCLELLGGGWLTYGTTVAAGGKRDNYVDATIITAANDFIVGSGAKAVVKKTLAEVRTLLGLPTTVVGTTDTQTLSGKTLTAPKITSSGYIADSNGNELIKLPATVASAINEITVSNAAAGVAPSIAATGGDTNIDLNLVTKGTGVLKINGAPLSVQGAQTFTANGSFTVPAGVTKLYVTAVAAGNPGSTGTIGTIGAYSPGAGGNGGTGGKGGNGGEYIEDYPIDVTPGQVISVTVGTGNTVFGLKVLAKGAGAPGYTGTPGTLGQAYNVIGIGGAGGPGGPSPFGSGGLGGAASSATGSAAVNYGAGGGGGAGGDGTNSPNQPTPPAAGTGGSGAQGCLTARW